jgi:hypothetical protein
VPAEQLRHAELPEPVKYVPAKQFQQLVVAYVEYLPAVQLRQLAAVAAETVE